MKVSCWSSHDGRGLMYSTCHQGVNGSGREWYQLGTQHFSVGLAGWKFGGGGSWISLGKWEFMMLSSCLPSISAAMATLYAPSAWTTVATNKSSPALPVQGHFVYFVCVVV